MKRNFLMAGAIALASMLGFGQAAQSIAVKSGNEINATKHQNQKRQRLPFVSPMPKGGNSFKEPGLSPKEYGMRFGTGASKKHKSNRLRYSHNAKLKRRIA